MLGRWLGAVGVGALLAGCGAGQRPAGLAAPAEDLASVVLVPQATPEERRLEGVIEAVNQGTVAAQTAGRVEEIFYDVNDFVPKGAVIMRLRSTEQHSGLAQAQAALAEATARETEAQTRHRRLAGLYEHTVVSRAALDEATAARDAAVARLTAAQAAVRAAQEGVAYTEVRAPYAGVVARRLVQVGETVSAGTPLMAGLSLQYLRVNVDVPQSIVDQVRRLRKAAVYIGSRRIEATRLTLFPEASAPSSTFRARLDLPENAADLYPGMFVKVGLVTGEEPRLLVPTRSIREQSEVAAVYTVGPRGDTAMRQVRLGERFGDRTEVLSGLMAGDHVALDPLAAALHAGPDRRVP